MKSRKIFSTEFVTTNRARPWALYAGNTPRPAVPGKEQKGEKRLRHDYKNKPTNERIKHR
jgi:hypothetical protein